MSDTQPPVGIDLGTTYSVIAFLDPSGRPTTIVNSEGDLLLPSAVAFEPGAVVVGKEAVKASVMEPARFAECMKRDMGEAVFRRRLAGREVPPEVLSAFILRRLKEDAEQRIGPVRRVVVTVPAFFDETRREATQEAGRLAGLEVLDIINEPTAAAVAFGYHTAAGGAAAEVQRVLVYDLGGGTFDVTILQLEGGEFRTLATDGDVKLGGKDFDQELVNYVAEQFLAEHGADPRSDPQDAAQLWLDAQNAKHALSLRPKATVVCQHAGLRMRIEISREQFQSLAEGLLERTKATTALVLAQAGLQWSDIGRVLLVGGSSRMPMVGQMLRELTGKEPDRSLSADEVVAHGAALYAGMLAEGAPAQARLALVNVNSHSLGVVGVDAATGQRRVDVVIPKNTPLPTSHTKQYRTARDGQEAVVVPIVEGENTRPEHCISLGKCAIRNLPGGLPRGTPVEVTFQYAANGRISVTARVPGQRHTSFVEIQRNSVRNARDLAAWEAELTEPEAPPPPAADGRLRLEAIYLEIGKRAARIALPPALRPAKEAALAANAELRRAREQHAAATAAEKTAVGTHEKATAGAAVAKAQAAAKQGETRLRLALLALGRQCVESRCLPPGAEQLGREAAAIHDSTAGG